MRLVRAANKDCKGRKVLWETQDLLVLKVCKANKARLVRPVQKAHVVKLDYKVYRVKPDPLAHRDRQVRRVNEALSALLVHRVIRVQWARKVSRVSKAGLVQQVPMDLRDLKETRAQPVHKE